MKFYRKKFNRYQRNGYVLIVIPWCVDEGRTKVVVIVSGKIFSLIFRWSLGENGELVLPCRRRRFCCCCSYCWCDTAERPRTFVGIGPPKSRGFGMFWWPLRDRGGGRFKNKYFAAAAVALTVSSRDDIDARSRTHTRRDHTKKPT